MGVIIMTKPLVTHPQVEKAIRRLRNMGLKVNVLQGGDREVYIFVDLNSVAKLIEKQIMFPNKKVTIEDNYIVIFMWKKYGV